MLRLLRAECTRMLSGATVYIVVVLLVALYILGGKTEFWQSMFCILSYADELYFAAPALLGLISASTFADDMNSGYYRPLCLRYGVSAYVRAKAVSMMLMPFCVAIVCHVAAFVGMVAAGVPVYLIDSSEGSILESSRYLGWMLRYGQWWPYMLGGGICLGAGSCLLIAIAAYASVYMPSRLFIWALPVILNLTIMISASYLRVPNQFNINRIMRGRVAGLEPCPTLYIFALLVLPTALVMWAFVRAARRRVLNA